MHGKVDTIYSKRRGIFQGLPASFEVTRYHSLAISKATLPACLEITAVTEDEEIMGVRHKEFAIEGVQFHPESILSEYGHELLNNFLKITN
jgi:anthranilate synthase component 2